MASPSILGDVGAVATVVQPFSSSTALIFLRTSDTGTVVTTSRSIDLSRTLHVGVTGGKPLDLTLHPRKAGPPRWQGAVVSLGMEMVFHSSGKRTNVTVAHKTRSAASGAGSTWETLKTDVFSYKMGTDTDGIFHTGLESSANLMAVKRFYKANVTFAWKTTTDSAAQDTGTDQELMVNSALIRLYAGEHGTIAAKVS